MKTDIHHHFIPNIMKRYRPELPDWSVDDSLKFARENLLDNLFLSIPLYDISFKDSAERMDFCREANRELNSIIKEYPEIFRGFGVLPFPDLDNCMAELNRCIQYGFDGIIMFSNTGGIYPSSLDHKSLFEVFNDKQMRLFIHPAEPPLINGKDYAGINNTIEFPQEVPRLFSRLLIEDCFEKYHSIKFVLGHGGGLFPFQYSKIGKLVYMKESDGLLKIRWDRVLGDMLTKRNRFVEYMKNVEIDLFETTSAPQSAALREYFEPDKCLFGSNFPFSV